MRAHVELVIDIHEDDAEAHAALDDHAHPRRLPFLDAARSLGDVVVCRVRSHDEVMAEKTQAAEADVALGWRRAESELVEAAHLEIDLLEPAPPREEGGRLLSIGERIAWYREGIVVPPTWMHVREEG